MSLTIVAISGILLGFLCVMVGFFMDGGGRPISSKGKRKKMRHLRRRHA